MHSECREGDSSQSAKENRPSGVLAEVAVRIGAGRARATMPLTSPQIGEVSSSQDTRRVRLHRSTFESNKPFVLGTDERRVS